MVGYLWNEIVVSNKKERAADKHSDIGEPCSHYMKGKKWDTKKNTYYIWFHLYKLLARQNQS